MSDLRRYFAERWDDAHAEELLLHTYDLTPDSIVFDVGGYRGNWANEIVTRYNPHVYIFEPVSEFCETLRWRFSSNPKVVICPYGLASENAFLPVGIRGSGSSPIPDGQEVCEFRQLQKDQQDIDLMAVNIEGGEYDLLPHLIHSGIIELVNSLVIQFHAFWPNSYTQWQKIREGLSKTHTQEWCYPFVWEKWVRK